MDERPQEGGGGNGAGGASCPADGIGYTGETEFVGQGPKAAPLRGTVGCIDANNATGAPLTVEGQVANIIYGPMENGFSSQQFSCLGETTIPGGIDSLTAESMVAAHCGSSVSEVSVLDACGGHARPYHYHERMSCLYTAAPTTGHSTRLATMLDGRGLYGKFVATDTLPADLDACGGRTGVTPDSNGEPVYYYMVQDRPPFTVGCFGPVTSVEQCRSLYPDSCGNGDEITVTTDNYGSFRYDPDCPCYEPTAGYITNIPAGETTPNGTLTSLSTPTEQATPVLAPGGTNKAGLSDGMSLMTTAMLTVLSILLALSI